MALHVFVVMPFGVKGNIDFNKVYSDYIKPALEGEGYQVFRADEERRGGDILIDMFQELLLADLVVADLSIDNPNVWYELGVRHALRARGIVLIQSQRDYQPFDIYTNRKLHYHIKDSVPDPEFIEADKIALARMAKETMESWHGRKISPVYQLVPNLQENEWKSLRIGNVREFWEKHESWQNRVELARKTGRIGDLLVLADEAPVSAFRAEACITAGEALLKAERFDFALEQLDQGLEIEPTNLKGLRSKGICLQRLAISGTPEFSLDRARAHYQEVLTHHPKDSETLALLGRLDKDDWVATWRRPAQTAEQMRAEAAYEDALLRDAIESYVKAFRRNPVHYYSGINALALMYLHRYLTADNRYDKEMILMAGAVRYSAECESDESQRYWSEVTLGDLEVLTGTPQTVRAAYKEAVANNVKSWFDLNSSLAQLFMLKDLGFNSDNVEAGIATFERAKQKLARPEDQWQPRQVILFSGHMIDAPDRPTPRFPA
ncbi:MAG: TRAFs-binding domain-containing protein, partial [Chlorobium sp.]